MSNQPKLLTKIYYFYDYTRLILEQGNRAGYYPNCRRVNAVAMTDKGEILLSAAICCPDDRFQKKAGRNIVTGRINSFLKFQERIQEKTPNNQANNDESNSHPDESVHGVQKFIDPHHMCNWLNKNTDLSKFFTYNDNSRKILSKLVEAIEKSSQKEAV